MKNSGSDERSTLDFSTLIGAVLGFGGILGGLLLEGGKVTDIGQATGAIIVFGGTLGAVMITSPQPALLRAFRSIKLVFFQPSSSMGTLIESLIHYANAARRNGIVSLEQEVDSITDPFLRKALALAVDGTDLQDLKATMELEIVVEENQAHAAAKVYEAAGGYSPTIGIIGAVLGLIQVMKHLDNIQEVGHGIAVAFVATIYGVGAANLIFLPAAAKLKARAEQSMRRKEFLLEGVSSIVQGLHPKVIERKLEAYLRDESSTAAEGRRSGLRRREAEA